MYQSASNPFVTYANLIKQRLPGFSIMDIDVSYRNLFTKKASRNLYNLCAYSVISASERRCGETGHRPLVRKHANGDVQHSRVNHTCRQCVSASL